MNTPNEEPADVVKEIRANVLSGLSTAALLEQLDKLAVLLEEKGDRQRAEDRIRGELLSLLIHEIAARELVARGGQDDPVLGKWKKEIATHTRVIRRANEAPQFRDGWYFTGEEIDTFAREAIEEARWKAVNKLYDWHIEELSDPTVLSAQSASDLGVVF